MYHPWQPEWLDELDYSEDGEPVPFITMAGLFELSRQWVATVVDAKAEQAKREIAAMAHRAGTAVDRVAFQVGQCSLVGIVAAEVAHGINTDRFDEGHLRQRDMNAYRWQTTPWRDRARWWIGRRIRGTLALLKNPLRKLLWKLDKLTDKTYGW